MNRRCKLNHRKERSKENEVQEVTAECVRGKTREELDSLMRSVEDQLEFFELDEKDPSIRLGSNGDKAILPYKELTDEEGEYLMSYQDYFDLMVSLIETPNDVYRIINPPFVRWKGDSSQDDILLSGPIILAAGGGDCDNLSWLAKELMDALSCKKGHDYKARVIGMKNHAACIYHDTDGQWKAIDQGDHRKFDINNILGASRLFPSKMDESLRDISLTEDGIRVQRYLDPSTLLPNYSQVQVNAYLTYQDGNHIQLSEVVGEDYEKYDDIQVFYKEETVVIYRKGKLFHVEKGNGTIEAYSSATGRLETIQYPDGRKILFDDSTGEKSQEKKTNGDIYYYRSDGGSLQQIDLGKPDQEGFNRLLFNEAGELIQKNKANGEKHLYENGNLKQINYPDNNAIVAELYDEQGRLTYREFRDTNQPYKIIFYEEGQPVQVEKWDGNQQLYQP